MLDRSGCSILLFWLMFWTVGWLLQTNALTPRPKPSRQLAFQPGIELFEAKWFIRVLFGLSPRDGKIKLRPAIMQGLALVMAVVEILVRYFFGVQNLLGFTVILLMIYIAILLLSSFLLDRAGRP